MTRHHHQKIAQEPVWVLGTMSGTSLDGVDAAYLQTDGHAVTAFGPHGFLPYSADERAGVARAFGQFQGGADVAGAAQIVERAHIRLLAQMLADHPDFAPAYIGFHGQTLAHDPRQNRTHQAGDGAALALALNVPVVWDFRSSDVALGGEGAPLAPFFHHAAARWARLNAPVALVNLGGVGNITWLDPRAASPEQDGALLAFDTGPANAPINDLMLSRLGLSHDENGALAAAGRVDEAIVARALSRSYFHKIPPKSLDRNDFHDLMEAVAPLSDADACATLTAVAAASVAAALEHCPSPPEALYITGGGRHNAVMMREIAARAGVGVGVGVHPVEALHLNGDMLEAQAFAYLALRVALGLSTSGPMTTGVAAYVGGGTVSRP